MNSPADTNSRNRHSDVRGTKGLLRPAPTTSRLLLGAITAGALLLRTLHLSEKSFWLDEAASWAIARLSWSDFWRILWARELNMGLYYLLLRGWLHLGSSEAALRSLSVLFGVVSVPLVYYLGKRLFDRYSGIAAAILLTLHAAHVSYSQEARAYTLAMLAAVLSMMLFADLVESPGRATLVVYVLVTSLAVYAHFFCVLLVPAQWLSLLSLRRSPPWRQLLLATGMVAALIAPAIMFVLTRDVGQLIWIPRNDFRNTGHLVTLLLGNGIRAVMFVGLGCVALWEYIQLRRSGDSGWSYALVLSWCVTPVLLALLISLKRPVLIPRFFLICLPGVVLLAGHGVRLLRPAWLSIGSLALLGILLLTSVKTYYTRPKDDWRAATRWVAAQAQSGDAVLVWNAQQAFDYYQARFPVPPEVSIFENYGWPISLKLVTSDFVARYPHAWLMSHDSAPYGDENYRKLVTVLERTYRSRQDQAFNGVHVTRFGFTAHEH